MYTVNVSQIITDMNVTINSNQIQMVHQDRSQIYDLYIHMFYTVTLVWEPTIFNIDQLSANQ